MKKIYIFTVTALIITVFSLGVFAVDGTAENPSNENTTVAVSELIYDEKLPRVVDNADLLDEDEENELNKMCLDIIKTYGADAVIVTVNGTDYKSAEEYADDYYDYNGYGVGPECDGVLLLVDMESRNWHISTTGSCIYSVGDYGIDALSSNFLPLLSDGDYFECFSTFLNDLPEWVYTEDYSDDNNYYGNDDYEVYPPGYIYPDDTVIRPEPMSRVSKNFVIVLISFFFASLFSALIAFLLSRQMKTTGLKKSSDMYIANGGLHLTDSRDLFLYSNTSMRPRPKPTNTGGGFGSHNSGSGGVSVHTGSSGTSHGGGGGGF